MTACGAPPKLVGDKVHEGPKAKIDKVMLFYQEQNMTATLTSTNRPGDLGVTTRGFGETGFAEFGAILVKEAPTSFAKHRVELLRAEVIPPGRWRDLGGKAIADIGAERRRGALLVTISPQRGQSSANKNEAHVTFRFIVRALDVNTAKLQWEGAIDAYTYTGNAHFGNKGTNFDAAYAQQFIDIITDNLRKNGML